MPNPWSRKGEVIQLLEETALRDLEGALRAYPPTKIHSYLIGALLHPKEEVRWKAIFAFGLTVKRVAEEEIERARVIIRRLMWMLNEESGGMGWGIGEAFAEALYNSERLKEEYLQVYLSYLWPEGNYLEFPPAQRGIVWGLGRLAQKYERELLDLQGPQHLLYHLSSPDTSVCFLSLWALLQFPSLLGKLKGDERPLTALNKLKALNWEVLIFDGKSIKVYRVKDLDLLIP